MSGRMLSPKLYPLIGRDSEMGVLSGFLSDSSPTGCLVFAGEAGIGKTTLWQVGLEIAADRGYHVLSTRASQGEARLLFAALADFMDGVNDEVTAGIPSPQMHALEVALRRTEPADQPPEPFAISSGFLAAVRALSAEGRPLVAVDDVQWLDPSSADCLLFLARRATNGQVRFLLSRRSDEPSALERALEPAGVELVEVEPMSVGAISRLLAERFGLVLPRRVLHRIYEASQGNPLFALELGRTIHEAGVPDIGWDLPVPRLVDDAFDARVQSLPDAIRQALLAVALSPGLTRRELVSLVDPLAVEDALHAGLLVADRIRVRPSHPMLAAAARKGSSALQRRDLHLALSEVVADPVLSARHLALATVSADAAVANVVATAAQLAVERGAVHEAEELSAHALRLTPAGAAEEPDRLLELARCHLTAGDLAGTAALLQGRINHLPAGRPRALAHMMLGEASDGMTEEQELDRALADIGDDRLLYGVALCRKAVLLSAYRVQRLVEAEALAREALTYTEGTVEEGRGRMALGWALVLRGRPVDHLRQDVISVRPGVQLFDTAVDRPAGIRLAFRGEVDAAVAIMQGLAAIADERGDPRSRVGMNIQLCEFALRKGDLAGAQGALEELDQWVAIDELRVVCARLKALGAAIAGHPVDARRWGDIVLAQVTAPHRATWDLLEARRALGLAALLDGDFRVAVDQFLSVWSHCRREGVDDPGAFPVGGDLIEALVESGDLSQAGEILESLADLSESQRHPWGLATTARGRAILALATEETEAAVGQLMGAAGGYQALGLEFEQARCLLFLGRANRRSKRRGGARQALEQAVQLFDRLGCHGWAAAGRGELARVSGRRAADDNELTPSEQRVVDLAVSGLSNKDIAKVLFVSVYTVEAHLSHAYAKLGIRSRTQLAGRLSPG